MSTNSSRNMTLVVNRVAFSMVPNFGNTVGRVGHDSSVGIATGYGLGGPEIKSWWGKISVPVQTCPEANPVFYIIVPGFFHGSKAAEVKE
jgi:hypothetical protein